MACLWRNAKAKPAIPRVGNRRYEQGDLLSMPVDVIDCDRGTGHRLDERPLINYEQRLTPQLQIQSLIRGHRVPRMASALGEQSRTLRT